MSPAGFRYTFLPKKALGLNSLMRQKKIVCKGEIAPSLILESINEKSNGDAIVWNLNSQFRI